MPKAPSECQCIIILSCPTIAAYCASQHGQRATKLRRCQGTGGHSFRRKISRDAYHWAGGIWYVVYGRESVYVTITGGIHAGIVYKGRNICPPRNDVAIKVESRTALYEEQLEHEYDVYRSLAGVVGIPRVFWLGAECGYNIMVMQLLGPSLEDVFNSHNRKFTANTVLLLADQLVRAPM